VLGHLSRSRDCDVYDVWSDERECRCVAKVLRPDRLESDSAKRHLYREGHLLQRLAHPHIVRAYEVLEEPQPIVILETLTGATLSYILAQRRHRLPLEDVVFLGLQLASALRYIHRHDVLHLDLKPSNIVSAQALAKLIDLSVARPPGSLPSPVGTDDYMAPEQARHTYATEATDVWGLGMVLFEAAVGEGPFVATGRRRTYPQVRERAPSVRTLRRVPQTFAKAVDGCLEPEQEQRPTLTEVAVLLAELVHYH
jgi:eukaryotic-like serine/threonine-protein kinase